MYSDDSDDEGDSQSCSTKFGITGSLDTDGGIQVPWQPLAEFPTAAGPQVLVEGEKTLLMAGLLDPLDRDMVKRTKQTGLQQEIGRGLAELRTAGMISCEQGEESDQADSEEADKAEPVLKRSRC